jgi:chromosomal replication initiator protein
MMTNASSTLTSNIFAKHLKDEIDVNDYIKYFRLLSYQKAKSNDELAVFKAPNKFVANWINSHYIEFLQSIFKKYHNICPKINIIHTNKKSGKSDKSNNISKSENSNSNSNSIESTLLNPSYTFDSFVVGPSNQMAYNASLSVVDKPGIQYNPLFFYGGTGLGKTHLLQAIGNKFLENGRSVIYVTIEQFTNDFTFSLRNKSMEHFRNKYRNCDVLLIDDIQFLSGKEQTQEEFFHTFNELHNLNKQIVLTSDKMPSQIAGFEERLKSRFEWGLTIDIQIPGLETKIAIIEKMSELNGFKLNNEVINYIASNIGSSVREIEGILIKINATSKLLNQDISLELVQNILKEHIKDQKENITLAHIISVVSKELNIKPSEIKSKKRTKPIANARKIVIYLTKELTHNSMPTIAKEFGMKDHSAVSHNIRTTNELIAKDENLKVLIANLKNVIINQ